MWYYINSKGNLKNVNYEYIRITEIIDKYILIK